MSFLSPFFTPDCETSSLPISFLCLPGMTGSLKEGGKGEKPQEHKLLLVLTLWVYPRNHGSAFTQAWMVSLPTSFSGAPSTCSPPPGSSYFARPTRNCCWDTDRKSGRLGSSCCVWMSDPVHPLCSLALYSGTPALIGVSLGLAAFSCCWNTVSPSPPLILCADFFNVPSPLLFCSSDSCSRLFLPVLQSKFEKGVGVVRWGLLPSPTPSFLLCYGFRRASLLLPAASQGRVRRVWVD